MMRKGLGVPKVDSRQEITLLAGGELLEHLLDIDVRHYAGLEVGWVREQLRIALHSWLAEVGLFKRRKKIQIESFTD